MTARVTGNELVTRYAVQLSQPIAVSYTNHWYASVVDRGEYSVTDLMCFRTMAGDPHFHGHILRKRAEACGARELQRWLDEKSRLEFHEKYGPK